MKIRLKKIDLAKGHEHEHPDIRTGREYLARIDGVFHAGQFCREWYGWNFEGWRFNPGAGLQYDQPGTNSSDWQDLWEIIPQKVRR